MQNLGAIEILNGHQYSIGDMCDILHGQKKIGS
jgi:hypothetical protein